MEFWKMNGAGNDFIVLDNRTLRFTIPQLQKLAQTVCHRHLSIGADGLMAVDHPTQGRDYKMLFFNADGSIGEMCGNGARCICRYGYENGLAGETQTVETTAGIVTGTRISERLYRIRLNDPSIVNTNLQLDVCGETRTVSYVELGNPGIPHAVVEIPDLAERSFDDLRQLGKALRYHPAFPKGANVNFFAITDRDHVLEKTYERGVEDFTYACGTGTGSVITVLTLQDRVSGNNVQVDMPGGTLSIDIDRTDNKIENLWLTGPTNIVCKGHITDEELVL